MRFDFHSRVIAGTTSAVAGAELTQTSRDTKSPRTAVTGLLSASAPLRLCVEPHRLALSGDLHTNALLLVLGLSVVIYLVMGR